jgi:hypothetical protein
MRRTITAIAGLVVVLTALTMPLAMHTQTVYAASAPTPTDTAVPTQTPYATNTPYATGTPAPTYTPYPSATPAHHPAIALSSSQGISTTHIVAIVDDFPPQTTVTLYWDETPHILGRKDVDESGYTRFDVTIPDAPVGPHEVRAVGAHHTSAGAPYNVTGPIVIGGSIPGIDPTTGGVAGAGGCDGPLAFHIPVPFGSPICIDTIGMLTGLFVGAVQGIGGGIKWGMDKVTAGIAAPFITVLTQTPDFSDTRSGDWAELNTFFGDMQDLAFGLYGVLSLIGLCKVGLATIGRANVVEAVDVLWRSVLGLVAVIILPDVLHLWFVGLQDLTTAVLAYTGGTDAGALARISLDTKTAGTIFGSAVGAVWATLLMTIFGIIFTVVGVIILLLTALTKLVGLFLLATLYGISPLMIACWVLPEASGFARGWASSFINVSLWGVGYAVVLKMIVVMEFGLHMDGFLQPLLGLAGLMVLYRVPKIIASLNPGGAMANAAGAHAPAGAITGLATAAATGNAAGAAAGLAKGLVK